MRVKALIFMAFRGTRHVKGKSGLAASLQEADGAQAEGEHRGGLGYGLAEVAHAVVDGGPHVVGLGFARPRRAVFVSE